MPDFGRSANFARRRHSESVFISPSLGVLFHHPPRLAPQKNRARLRFNSTGVDSPNARTSSTRQNAMRHRDYTRPPDIKTQTCAHFGAEAAAGYPATRSQAVSSSASRTSWAGVQGMRTSGAMPRPSVTPTAPAMPICRLRHPYQGPHHSSSMRDTNLKIILLIAPSTAKACMMLPVIRI